MTEHDEEENVSRFREELERLKTVNEKLYKLIGRLDRCLVNESGELAVRKLSVLSADFRRIIDGLEIEEDSVDDCSETLEEEYLS